MRWILIIFLLLSLTSFIGCEATENTSNMADLSNCIENFTHSDKPILTDTNVTTAMTIEDETQEPPVSESSSTDIMSATEERSSQQTSTDAHVDRSDSSPCTHHKVSGEILIRTVTWTENNTYRIWTCTQCGATGAELIPSSDTTNDDIEIKTELSTDDNSPTETTTADTESTNVTTEQISPASPYDVAAKEGTEELLAERILYYINVYRKEAESVPAEALSGLTKLSKIRSQQLIVNYGHSLEDIRSAATGLQYGRYVDPTIWGWDVEPYYEPPGQEAIGEFSNLCTYSVDQMANRIANCVKNSQAHWSYIGAVTAVYREYKYIGVGVSFSNNSCYICIFIANTNMYG